jgi:hypothetical protein
MLGLSEESAEVLTQQMYVFFSEGYLRVGEAREAAPSKRPRKRP